MSRVNFSAETGLLFPRDKEKMIPTQSGSIFQAFNDSHGNHFCRNSFQVSESLRNTFPYKFASNTTNFACVAFDKTNENIAVCDEKGHLFLLQLKLNTYTLVKRIGKKPTNIIFSPSKRNEVIISFEDNSVESYEVTTKQLISSFIHHPKKCSKITHISTSSCNNAISADNETAPLVAISSSDHVSIWDLLTMKKIKTLTSKTKAITSGAFSLDEEAIITCLGNEILIWDSKTYTISHKLSIPESEMEKIPEGATLDGFDILVSNKTKTLVTASSTSNNLFIWDLQTNSLKKIVTLFSGPDTKANAKNPGIIDINLQPNGKDIAVLTKSGTILFLNEDATKVQFRIGSSKTPIHGLKIDNSWKMMATLHGNGTMQIFDLDFIKNRKSDCVTKLTKSFLQNKNKIPSANFLEEPVVHIGTEKPELVQINTNQTDDVNEILLPESPEQKTGENFLPSNIAEPSESSKNNPDPINKMVNTFPVKIEGKEWKDPYKEMLQKQKREVFNVKEMKKEEIVANFQKLRRVLNGEGSYPKLQRKQMWKVSLSLPENKEAFEILLKRGTHPAICDLGKRFPIVDSIIFRRLEKVNSALTYLSPIFGSAKFIPELIFPFIKIYEFDLMGVFEMLVTWFMNWGCEWFETFPNPPVSVMNVLEDLLRFHDFELYSHFRENGISPVTWAWTPMKTLYTEILNSNEWLRLFDHIFSRPPAFFYFFVIAYVLYFRKNLIFLLKKEDFKYFFAHLNPCDVNETIKMAYDLQNNSKNFEKFPKHYFNLKTIEKGFYPIFNNYPKKIVDLAMKEREKIFAQELEMEKSRKNYELMKRQAELFEKEQKLWFQKKEILNDAEQIQRSIQLELDMKLKEEMMKNRELQQITANQQMSMMHEMQKQQFLLLENQKKQKQEFEDDQTKFPRFTNFLSQVESDRESVSKLATEQKAEIERMQKLIDKKKELEKLHNSQIEQEKKKEDELARQLEKTELAKKKLEEERENLLKNKMEIEEKQKKLYEMQTQNKELLQHAMNIINKTTTNGGKEENAEQLDNEEEENVSEGEENESDTEKDSEDEESDTKKEIVEEKAKKVEKVEQTQEKPRSEAEPSKKLENEEKMPQNNTAETKLNKSRSSISSISSASSSTTSIPKKQAEKAERDEFVEELMRRSKGNDKDNKKKSPKTPRSESPSSDSLSGSSSPTGSSISSSSTTSSSISLSSLNLNDKMRNELEKRIRDEEKKEQKTSTSKKDRGKEEDDVKKRLSMVDEETEKRKQKLIQEKLDQFLKKRMQVVQEKKENLTRIQQEPKSKSTPKPAEQNANANNLKNNLRSTANENELPIPIEPSQYILKRNEILNKQLKDLESKFKDQTKFYPTNKSTQKGNVVATNSNKNSQNQNNKTVKDSNSTNEIVSNLEPDNFSWLMDSDTISTTSSETIDSITTSITTTTEISTNLGKETKNKASEDTKQPQSKTADKKVEKKQNTVQKDEKDEKFTISSISESEEDENVAGKYEDDDDNISLNTSTTLSLSATSSIIESIDSLPIPFNLGTKEKKGKAGTDKEKAKKATIIDVKKTVSESSSKINDNKKNVEISWDEGSDSDSSALSSDSEEDSKN